MNPTRSTKTIETTRRSSAVRPGSASGAPHALQKLAPSGFSCPQRAQVSIREAYARSASRLRSRRLLAGRDCGRLHGMCSCARITRVSARGLHDEAGAARHLRDGRVDALARVPGRDVGARAGRERLRCRVRDRVRPAGGRAAPERPGRRDAGGLLFGRARRGARALRAGSRASGGDDRALPRARARARSRNRRPGRLRPGRLRRVAPASAGVRNLAPGGRPRARYRVCGGGLSARPGSSHDDRPDRGAPRDLAGLA